MFTALLLLPNKGAIPYLRPSFNNKLTIHLYSAYFLPSWVGPTAGPEALFVKVPWPYWRPGGTKLKICCSDFILACSMFRTALKGTREVTRDLLYAPPSGRLKPPPRGNHAELGAIFGYA